MKKLGMNALLGVGQGSTHDARMVVMQWNGARKSAKGKDAPGPLAFIGKGVCFDSGGLSLKTGAGMMGMKGDMAGAAAVVGVMHALAKRKARVDAVGLIGLVENMPDGNAQRPNDIVKTMSGQTIEILNTDAEGRLVLADVLWYAQERFKPKFMIDLATLTGAIIIALGQEYAGLFANDDDLAIRLTKVGEETGEKVWRMPLGPFNNPFGHGSSNEEAVFVVLVSDCISRGFAASQATGEFSVLKHFDFEWYEAYTHNGSIALVDRRGG
jgi:leucyl aminopeptidase